MTSMTDSPVMADDLTIINILKKTPAGTQIPEEGPLGFLYSQIGGEGETIVFNSGKRLQVMYIDHEDVISSIQPDKAQFSIYKQNGTLFMNIVLPYSDNNVSLHFSFNLNSQSGMDTLRQIASRKKIHMNFISIEYGSLVKSFHAPVKLPKTVIKQFK